MIARYGLVNHYGGLRFKVAPRTSAATYVASAGPQGREKVSYLVGDPVPIDFRSQVLVADQKLRRSLTFGAQGQ